MILYKIKHVNTQVMCAMIMDIEDEISGCS